MTADCEMAGNADFPKIGREATVLRQKILKDQRKTNHQGFSMDHATCNPLGAIADIHHYHRASTLLENSGQITHPKIALILIANQYNIRTFFKWRSEEHT